MEAEMSTAPGRHIVCVFSCDDWPGYFTSLYFYCSYADCKSLNSFSIECVISVVYTCREALSRFSTVS